jgi:hypothetical protein
MNKMIFILLAFFLAGANLISEEIAIVAHGADGVAETLSHIDVEAEEVTIHITDPSFSPDNPIVDIEGLEKLEQLKSVKIVVSPQIADFSFLSRCSSIEKVLITLSRVTSISFIYKLPELGVLALERSDDWESELGLPFINDEIDLSGNTKLEYIAFKYCELQVFPHFTNVPATLKYLDLTGNDIKISKNDLHKLEELTHVPFIFIEEHKMDTSTAERYPNLTPENPETIVPDYWQ